MSWHVSPSGEVDFSRVPIYYGVGASEPGESEDEVFIPEVKEMKPSGFFFVSDSEGKLGSKAYHSLLIGGSVSVVGEYGRRESFFGPMILGYKVVVNEVSGCSGI